MAGFGDKKDTGIVQNIIDENGLYELKRSIDLVKGKYVVEVLIKKQTEDFTVELLTNVVDIQLHHCSKYYGVIKEVSDNPSATSFSINVFNLLTKNVTESISRPNAYNVGHYTYLTEDTNGSESNNSYGDATGMCDVESYGLPTFAFLANGGTVNGGIISYVFEGTFWIK